MLDDKEEFNIFVSESDLINTANNYLIMCKLFENKYGRSLPSNDKRQKLVELIKDW